MRLLQVARLSRSHDGSTALDKQDGKTRQYADAYGHEIIGVAADNGVSGSTDPFTRPELGPWLTEPALVASYDGIIASHLDRLGRSTRYIGKLLDWAKDHGKAVICIDPAVDFSTPVGTLIAFIISWLAEQELALITSRSKDTQDHLLKNGFLVGKPPYGFRVAAKGDHKIMEPDPAEAAFIREAASRYLEGTSLRAICKWLDSQGSKPRHAATWSPVSLSQVFRNESLTGRRVDASGRTLLKHAPVLDRETWDLLQAELDRKASRKGIAPGNTAMLTGIAHCAKCDGPLYRINSRNKRKDGTVVSNFYYRCCGTDRQPSSCRNMIRLDGLEGWLDARMAADTSFVIETTVRPGSDHQDEIEETERDLRELDYDSPDFLDRQGALLAERARLKALPATPAEVKEEVAPYTVGDLWGRLGSAARRRYLLDCGVKVCADSADPSGWRIEGDTSHAARGGWSELVFTEA